MKTPSPLQQLIDREYKTLHRAEQSKIGSLDELIKQRRPLSTWRDIAQEITATTGIEISWETLRLWYADRITVEVKIAPASAGHVQ